MSKKGDTAAVRKDSSALLRQPEYDNGSAGSVLVRLAWQSAGTYDLETDTGGSNGAGMRYEAEGSDPANAGLQHARVFLDPVKAKHPWITYSDLWTSAAVVAVGRWAGQRFPGKTVEPILSTTPNCLLEGDCRMVRKEIVALSGAHNFGRCHADRSGFEGKWVNNLSRFSNHCFRLLKSMDGKKKALPSGIEQYAYVDEDLDEELMMLPTDVALLSDPGFAPWVPKYADSKELFFEDFSKVFARLLELGIERDDSGEIMHTDNDHDGYISAPKKSNKPELPKEVQGPNQIGEEAAPLQDENFNPRARL